ncbi:MAG TPA: thiamine pyrophosphate-dependent dehydrogenase E1 component subunit alpha [Chloroflexota bacterium]|nr:thiamine pyrophosphate-dependent dehydrogenase E1 component subunit alpha [Chloroflexota bacterium]
MTTSSDATAVALGPERLRALYRRMLLSRAVDIRAWTLSRQGRAHFVITSRGHEAAEIGCAFALQPGRDWVLPYYRSLALVLGVGMTPLDVLLTIFAREGDPSSGGRPLAMHFSRPDLRIVSGSSVVSTQIPHAVGLALAARLSGEDAVAVACFGEGGSSKGDFHEGLNFAAVQKLPAIFLCENNGYAISVPQNKQMAIADVAIRAEGYGMPGVVVDGIDPLAVYEAVSAARTRAVAGEGPTLIEAKVARFTPHSSDDDDRAYRSREEVAEALARDPIPTFARRLKELGILSDDDDQALQREVTAEVDAAVEAADAYPQPSADDLLTHVYAEEGD